MTDEPRRPVAAGHARPGRMEARLTVATRREPAGADRHPGGRPAVLRLRRPRPGARRPGTDRRPPARAPWRSRSSPPGSSTSASRPPTSAPTGCSSGWAARRSGGAAWSPRSSRRSSSSRWWSPSCSSPSPPSSSAGARQGDLVAGRRGRAPGRHRGVRRPRARARRDPAGRGDADARERAVHRLPVARRGRRPGGSPRGAAGHGERMVPGGRALRCVPRRPWWRR